jgi:hypothetical protein
MAVAYFADRYPSTLNPIGWPCKRAVGTHITGSLKAKNPICRPEQLQADIYERPINVIQGCLPQVTGASPIAR